ncbi:ScbA/BarX family gamma-butyrolactone biosynthesis protein [Streptomyces sp. NPDC003077]|uniref:ScbA/BarX family gamma-butyrolactone biosynthesis protein n=1 Tax=Streptomyces sp. NPDC003077 TaxID=3154443 RepID=UPI0033ADF354
MIDFAQDSQSPSASMMLLEIPAPSRKAAAITPAFAHRAAAEDVLVTDWRRRGDTAFSLTVDWSKRHRFFAPARGSAHHHMLIAQTLRQVGLGLTHAGLGVATHGNHFLLDDLMYAVDPRQHTSIWAPLRAEAEYSWTGRRGLRVRIGLYQDGRPFATGKSHFSWVPERVYRRLRGDRLTARPGAMPRPVAPSVVGRSAVDEVTLSATGRPNRWELISDTGHPALIDHAVDHVPGLVLLEAAQQAAYAFAGEGGFGPDGGIAPDGRFDPDAEFAPVSAAIRAHRYVEFDSPCFIEARAVKAWSAGASAVEVTGVQRGEVAFRCVIQGYAGRR